MKLSLYHRLSLSLLVVFIAIISVFYIWAQQLEQKTRYESEQNLHLSLAANLARDNPLLQQGVYDHQALKNLFHTLMVLGPAFEFYFVDPAGKIITHSITPTLIKRTKIDLLPLIQLTQNQASLPIYGDDPQHISRKKIFSAAPVFNGSSLQGYLYVIVTGERYESAFKRLQPSRQAELSILAMFGAMLFFFVVMLGIFAYFTRPLRRLSRDIKALRAVGFDKSKVNLAKWMPNSRNEVHQLGEAFEQMVKQINQQFGMLQKNDEHRRELLADISHDLRTPLSSLQGYIETLELKNDQVTKEQRQKYIEIALKNAQQLKGLIDQIFELAHLESGQVSLNLEAFNLAELLYDVVAKFSLQTSAKHIEINIVPECSYTQVHSDIGKLERVLSNLLENAIRHTAELGKITLSISEVDKNHCQLNITDTGTGIKEDELPYIFDTRYRASNAVQDKQKHTGLGLAITKKLLELLKSDIKVTSTLGEGTTFSINLSKVSL
ncbi:MULTISPECIES: cell wall metabolism sensor histidine kinase WalK [unclassified Colwellia]|uniref:sensor histidine kinase n=1 Tax=unclassified Colwellia TaxID=196834 RepID=UPI0015F5BE16|nr:MULTISPECIES: HAMP domain-containing sensor histidine kinase [unclassified Colwellia]MBA6380635.1 HAMP domain-containing histidine kinase [Colwellia sp. BRX10-7]MBA6387980.1 HAMP domain-containing histidine kinase [Colwellia sp. BRX10-2]MBA6402057.1 HAMP domain-containing histidine kinase [Colwellia sp. BRX10-5]MBA6406387.1 HAMP domain-containing histidine kinase [Colwellia sp. BRX10-1]